MHISGLLKSDIEKCLANIDEFVRNKTAKHIVTLFEKCGRDTIFGRSIVEQVTGLKSSGASEIINLMLENYSGSVVKTKI